MPRFVVVPFFLAQLLVMSAVFLRVDNPEGGRWYKMRSFGVGGVVAVEMDVEQTQPLLEVKLGNSDGNVLFDLVCDLEATKISTSLSEEEMKSGTLSLSGVKSVRLVVELQSEGVFVDLVGVGSVMLPYPAHSWSGNENTTWLSVDTISRVDLGGRGLKFTHLSGYVLV